MTRNTLKNTHKNAPVDNSSPHLNSANPEQQVVPPAGPEEEANPTVNESAVEETPETRIDVDALLTHPRDTADRRAEAFLSDWMRRFSRA